MIPFNSYTGFLFLKRIFKSNRTNTFNKKGVGCLKMIRTTVAPWWRQQMKTFSASLALCATNSPLTGEFPSQWPVARNFNAFLDLCLNKRISKQSRRWCLRRHRAHYVVTRILGRTILVSNRPTFCWTMHFCVESQVFVSIECYDVMQGIGQNAS